MKYSYYLVSKLHPTLDKVKVESINDTIIHNSNLPEGEYVLHIFIEGVREKKNALFEYRIPLFLSLGDNGVSEVMYSKMDTSLQMIYRELFNLIDNNIDINQFSYDNHEKLHGIEFIDYPKRVRNQLIKGGSIVCLIAIGIIWFSFIKPNEYDAIYVMKAHSEQVSQNTSFIPLIENGKIVDLNTQIAVTENHYLAEVLIKLQTELEKIQGNREQAIANGKNLNSFIDQRKKIIRTEIHSLESSIKAKNKLHQVLFLQNEANQKLTSIPSIKKETDLLQLESISEEIASMESKLDGLIIELDSLKKGILLRSNDPGDSYTQTEKISSYDTQISTLKADINERNRKEILLAWCDCIYIEDYFFDKSFRQLYLAKNEQYVAFSVKKRLYPAILGAEVEVSGIKGIVIDALTADQKKYFGFPNSAFSAFKTQVVVAKLKGNFNPQVFGHSTVVKVLRK